MFNQEMKTEEKEEEAEEKEEEEEKEQKEEEEVRVLEGMEGNRDGSRWLKMSGWAGRGEQVAAMAD